MSDITCIEWRVDRSWGAADVHAVIAYHDPYVLTVCDPQDGGSVSWELLNSASELVSWGDAPSRDEAKAKAIQALADELAYLQTAAVKEA